MKFTTSLLLLALLAGCATQGDVNQDYGPADRPAAAPVDVGIDWDWRVVGDAAARPVQAFSMDGQTYLQMRDYRPVVLLVNGEVIPYVRSWPHLIVQGEPAHIDVVLDGYRAVVERIVREQPAPAAAGQQNRVERVKLK